MMKRNILILCSIALVAVGVYFAVDTYLVTSAKPVDPLASSGDGKKVIARPFLLKDLNGVEVSPDKFKNKVLIVNFWASWCGPCVAEFPTILKLVSAYKDDVALIAISADNSETDIRTFLKKFSYENLPVYIAWDQDGTIAKAYGTNKLPESYIYARGNEFYRKIEGIKNWDSPAFLKTFESLVKN